MSNEKRYRANNENLKNHEEYKGANGRVKKNSSRVHCQKNQCCYQGTALSAVEEPGEYDGDQHNQNPPVQNTSYAACSMVIYSAINNLKIKTIDVSNNAKKMEKGIPNNTPLK